MLENVPGILTTKGGQCHARIMKEIRKIPDYLVYEKKLNAKDFGLPQSRNRWFCVGIRRDVMKPNQQFPSIVKRVKLGSFVDKALPPDDIAKYSDRTKDFVES